MAARVLMIGLDAADPVLVERWSADGTLPHIAKLRRDGTSGRLTTSAEHLAGSPWPTFYTSQPPSVHGIYHDFQWRQETMGYASPGGGWLSVRPFWRELDGDVDVVAYDIPMTPGAAPFRGIEITGWASHDKLAPPDSHPRSLLSEVRHRLGEWPIPAESFGRDRVGALLALRDTLIDNTRRSAELALQLLERPWRLAIVAFSALHRGGHRLYDRSSIEGPFSQAEGAAFDGALRDLYVECDRAVGRLRAAAPEATLVVFSLHGMTVNASRVDLLDGMLARVLDPRVPDARPRRGALRRIVESMPLAWRRHLTRRVPTALRDRLTTAFATGGTAWERTPAFALRADLQGYVRLNLTEREPRGIVPPDEVDALRNRIAEGLLSFRDGATGEPFVRDVTPIECVFPPGERAHRLPDLIVHWMDSPGASHHEVASPQLGVVRRVTPGRVPGGRSGNHRGEGFAAFHGPAVSAGGRLPADADIRDLAPTVLSLLGVPTRVPLTGRPLDVLRPQNLG